MTRFQLAPQRAEAAGAALALGRMFLKVGDLAGKDQGMELREAVQQAWAEEGWISPPSSNPVFMLFNSAPHASFLRDSCEPTKAQYKCLPEAEHSQTHLLWLSSLTFSSSLCHSRRLQTLEHLFILAECVC